MVLMATRQGKCEIVNLTGRFDAHTVPPVAAWLEERTGREGGPVRLVVDLGGVGFIDSTALAALVKGLKRSRQTGGDLRLCAMQRPVRIVFELTRLDRAFAIYDDAFAAAESYYD